MNRVKQEEEEAGAARQAGREHVFLPRRPTSLLSLPDDLLLSVYEELYEDQYGDKIISPPISEILVSKRLFNLVRPLWISRLSINSSELDRRLAALLINPLRLLSLRWISVSITETHVHLIGMTVSRLPSLAQLTLLIPAATPLSNQSILIDAIKASTSLKALNLLVEGEGWINPEIESMEKHFGEKLGNKLQRFNVCGNEYISRKLRGQQGAIAQYFCNSYKYDDFDMSVEEWSTLQSFESSDTRERPQIEEVLACLKRVFTRNLEQTGTVPLTHLTLQVLSYGLEERSSSAFFNPENFTTLFRLLSLTKLRRLELNALAWIPPILEQHLVPSVKLLRLSGPCRFAAEDNLRKLSNVLRNLPSLTQLHLVGSNFFHDNLGADDLSKLDDFTMSFLYPRLGTLLFALRTTEVKILTYRGENEKREMRWSRISKDEEFDRDCWTL
ncbi:hypothetical protein JCM5350_004358 [Sporobolomyces pararoseus]